MRWRGGFRRAKIAFDRFPVARHLGDTANTARKEERRRLHAEGDRTPLGTKYLWLERPSRKAPERRTLLSRLKGVCRRTGRAWSLNEMGSRLWDYRSLT
jgi:transposase